MDGMDPNDAIRLIRVHPEMTHIGRPDAGGAGWFDGLARRPSAGVR